MHSICHTSPTACAERLCDKVLLHVVQELAVWVEFLLPACLLTYLPTYLPACSCLPTCLLQAGDPAAASEGSNKRWYEEKKKQQEEKLAKMGLTPEDAHRLESAEVAEAKYKKNVGAWRMTCGVQHSKCGLPLSSLAVHVIALCHHIMSSNYVSHRVCGGCVRRRRSRRHLDGTPSTSRLSSTPTRDASQSYSQTWKLTSEFTYPGYLLTVPGLHKCTQLGHLKR